MPIIVKARPGEKQDRLIARFKMATKAELEEMKTRQYFVSETEKKQEAIRQKFRKIREFEKRERLGMMGRK